jgi:hypothetical protein
VPNPKLFIGSSSENLDVAYAMQERLERVAEVTVWDQGVFNLSRYNLEALLEALFATDFGAFVFAPDDVTNIRGQERSTVRDNVVFELGLFVGRLGRERSFIVLPRGDQDRIHLPTDLLGLTPAQYVPDREDGNLQAALAPACNAIARNIKNLGFYGTGASPPMKSRQVRRDQTADEPTLTNEELKVLRALVAGASSVRSLTGTAKDAGIPKDEVNALITSLMNKGFVDQATSLSSGQPRWFATEMGRRSLK